MNQSRHLRKSKLALGLVAALAAAPVFAQSTSAGVGGVVTDAGGAPVAGAEVTITHVESGTVSRATTDANGRYIAHGLRVGGPYTVSVVKQGAGTDTEEGIYLELNKVGNVDAQLHSGDATTLGTVAVVGSRETLAIFNPDNKGVGTSISGRALETAVSGNRSIDDIARLDPRITITDQSEGQMSVAGQNNRYNNISVDGLSVGDPFGLQASGLAFIGSPISADSIAAYDIKVSDYDVTSDSVGANINAVTKSGTNEFHGSVYRAQSNASSMVGKLDGKKYTGYDKNETTGATFGGPIVKDKLFFFVSYEEQKISGLAGVGSDALSTGRLTQSQVDEVANAFKTIGVDPGTATAAALENKRTVAKLDWNITDSQRASFTFQRTEEAKPQPYSSYAREYSVIMPSNWYNAASKTDNYSVQLFSDWTDNFSTELKIGYQKYGAVNGAAVDQPEVFACFSAVACPNNPTQISSSVPWVIAGEDRFRHENLIDSKRFTGTLSGTYYAGSHVIKGGVDFLSNEIANAFGQLLHGSYGFYDKNGNGTPADEILAKNYGTFVKNVLPNGVTLKDLAGAWTYRQISPFLQDTWQVNDNLSVVFGVRLNIPKADRSPPVAGYQPAGQTLPNGQYNPANPVQPAVWEHYFGYPSDTTLGSGNKVFEPRVAFNYNFNTPRMMQLRGGAGLFQSVPPYVWLTNPYTNNGVVSSKQYTSTNPVTDPFSADPNNQPGVQSSALPPGICVRGANCQIDVLDPNFKLPTAWKFSLGWDAELPWWGLIGTVEYQRIKHKNAIAYVLPNVGTPKGTLPDGRLSYWQTYPNANTSQVGNGSNNGAYPEIYYRSTLLTNTDLGGSSALTFSLDKPMSRGFGGNLSFTYTHATEVNPGTSSQAYSNYNWVARANPNEIVEAPSRYDIKYSIKASLNWEHAFFGDNKTSVSLYYNGHSGQPYSWVFGGNDVNGDAVASNVDLAYIPLVNDPIVTYKAGTTAEQIAAFQAFIDNDPYLASHRGRIAERGSSRQPWFNQVDLGVQQEFPGFFKSNKIVVRLDVYNFLNMLNKDWGTQDGLGFFASRRLVNVSDVVNGKYVYDLGTPTAPNWQEFGIYDTYTNPHRVISRWQALLTLKYKF
ncbi:TonB-dependent receptor [Pseudoxanthomonas helianthi]|uniref:TonB-dependent receptor n=1 Tax=Pseudoxanthomonas helianthi TaxID=1453541 RepID=A0A940WYB9_9GAMM|nr:TonB-dependent receptor [Pseudoxanthomonas helianthi]MBP3982917.1 TonB-dependent receptor [Pseudoxanthomonas helianthi]